MQVQSFLEFSADQFPEKIALISDVQRLTYGQLEDQANRLAHCLMEHGVERGDRILIHLDNCIEAVVSIFATLKAGGVFVLVNPSAKRDRLVYILKNCRPKAIVCQHIQLKKLHDQVSDLPLTELVVVIEQGPINGLMGSLKVVSFPDFAESKVWPRPRRQNIDIDLAALIYTSSSTGDPKGVMLTHLNMVSAANSIMVYLENSQDDIILNVLPLAFDYGLYQILMGFKAGATVILERSFTYPHVVLQRIEQEKVTGLPIVPTIAALLLRMDLCKYDFSSLRYVTSTAAALPIEHLVKLRGIFPQAKIFSMYGLTECKRVSYLPPDQLDIRPGSVGIGMPNIEVYIVDDEGHRVGPEEVGELVVRGSNVMRGYWGMPEATDRVLKPGHLLGERVLFTGDLFRMDEDGFLYFVGRKDDIIKTRGEKVSPKEIEDVLVRLAGVAEVAVVGIPDNITGQLVKAVIGMKEGYALTDQDIFRFCSEHLPSFMIPTVVEFRRVLPKSDNWKIAKRELR